MLHGSHERRDHQLARLWTTSRYRTMLLWAARPLVAALRWPSSRTECARGSCTGVHGGPGKG